MRSKKETGPSCPVNLDSYIMVMSSRTNPESTNEDRQNTWSQVAYIYIHRCGAVMKTMLRNMFVDRKQTCSHSNTDKNTLANILLQKNFYIEKLGAFSIFKHRPRTGVA